MAEAARVTRQYVEVPVDTRTTTVRLTRQYVEVVVATVPVGSVIIEAPTATATVSAPAPTVTTEQQNILPDPEASADYFENFSDHPWGTGTRPPFFFRRYSFSVGITVWKAGGIWYWKRTPSQAEIDQADRAATADQPAGEDGKYLFLGGHTYHVSVTVGTELEAAGFPVG